MLSCEENSIRSHHCVDLGDENMDHCMAISKAKNASGNMHNMCTERLHEQVSTTDTMHREVPENIAEIEFRP